MPAVLPVSADTGSVPGSSKLAPAMQIALAKEAA